MEIKVKRQVFENGEISIHVFCDGVLVADVSVAKVVANNYEHLCVGMAVTVQGLLTSNPPEPPAAEQKLERTGKDSAAQ